MKALVLNSSPMMDKGNTAVILSPFVEGMREAGAEVELLYTRKLKIKPCQGEFNCWLKTPGHCFQRDDMSALHPKLHAADILVFATPVYTDGVPGSLKNLMDRMIPLVQPYFELRDNHIRHVRREGHKDGKLVLVSNCGFWEMDNFDPLLVHVKAFCRNAGRQFAGALLRPHGPALKGMLRMGAPVQDILEAARDAGHQVVHQDEISLQTLAIVSRELLPRDIYIQMTNQAFRDALAGLEPARTSENRPYL